MFDSKYQENWLLFRSTESNIITEKYLFYNNADPDDNLDKDKIKIFVVRVESSVWVRKFELYCELGLFYNTDLKNWTAISAFLHKIKCFPQTLVQFALQTTDSSNRRYKTCRLNCIHSDRKFIYLS
jgi:hypothetical protein